MSDTKHAYSGMPNAAVIWRSIAISVVLPLIAIPVLLHVGVAPVATLAIATLFPLAEIGLEVAATRHVGLISGLALVGIGGGFGLTFVTGNGVFAVVEKSAFTFVFGMLFLGSLCTERPLIYRFNIQMAGTDPKARASSASLWEKPRVRAAFRLMTLVWGLGLVLEALARIAAGLLLPLASATALSPAIGFMAFGGLIAWNVLYVRVLQRRAKIGQAVAS